MAASVIHPLPLILIFIFVKVKGNRLLETGPIFLKYPPNKVTFLKEYGATISCSGHSYPDPEISWIRENGREVQNSEKIEVYINGSIVFKPVTSGGYLQDKNSAIYRCKLKNKFGTIISPPVHVSAVTETTILPPRVYDEYVIKGCTAVLKCQLPGYAKDNLKVIAWYKNDLKIHFAKIPTRTEKYLLSPDGSLHISDINFQDEEFIYKCKVRQKITNQEEISVNGGKLHLTGSQNVLQPNINDIVSEKTAKDGENILLPCAAQGSPKPTYSWYKIEGNSRIKVQKMILDAGSIYLQKVSTNDEGIYECEARNDIGFDRKKTKLIVKVTLQAYILPEKQVLDIGKPLIINCTVSGHPIDNISWFKNGNRLDVKGEKLKLLHTTEDSIGSYQCFAENKFQIAQAATTIFAGNRKPVIISNFLSAIKDPGENINLNCKAKGSPRPEIKWILDGKELQRTSRLSINSFYTSLDMISSTIQVMNTKVTDGGEYQCVAMNEIGKTRYIQKISITGPPFIRKMENLTVADGHRAVVRCYTVGYPVMKIYWTKGRKRLSNRRFLTFENGTLSIDNVRIKKDEGKYTCTAVGKNGVKYHRSVWIRVLVAPTIQNLFSSQTSSLQESLTLNCNIIRGTQPVDITWLKDGSPISFENGVVSSKTSLMYMLQIRSVQKQHQGNYTCIASNLAGKDMWSVNVDVNIPPEILNNQTDVWINKGKDSIIDCLAIGKPLPRIEWLRNEETLENSYKYILMNNGSLKIKNLDKYDEGIYTCVADNDIFPSASIDFNIFIGESPKLTCKEESSSDKDYREFKCFVKGSLPMSTMWQNMDEVLKDKNYTSIYDSNSTRIEENLIIKEKSKYRRKYIFHANNKLGEAKHIFKGLGDFPDYIPNILSTKIPTQNMATNENSFKRLKNFDSELNEAPVDDYHTVSIPDIKKNENVSPSTQDNKKGKVTFLQILVASVTTAIIILLFVLLLVLIVLWKRRTDKRDRQNIKYYESEVLGRNEEYNMDTINRRYGQLKTDSMRSFETLPGSNYYASITPYATFNPNNPHSSDTLKIEARRQETELEDN